LDRIERSVCGAGTGGDSGSRSGSIQGESHGRRDCLGPPAGRDRRYPCRDDHPCTAPQEFEVRHGDDVRRYRYGRRRYLRTHVTQGDQMAISTSKENGILTIAFDRLEKKNAITAAMYQTMVDAL